MRMTLLERVERSPSFSFISFSFSSRFTAALRRLSEVSS